VRKKRESCGSVCSSLKSNMSESKKEKGNNKEKEEVRRSREQSGPRS
jgi:hypothetical protein